MELNGKRALITGAAGGIGRAIAELFEQRGATLMLADIDAAAVQEVASQIGGDTHAVGCDVTDSSEVKAAVNRAVAELGGLDVLVNNAGIEIAKPLVELTEQEFASVLAVNVQGVFYGMKHAVPALAQTGGAVINIASVAGIGGAPLMSAYCASKAAVVRMTEAAAVELRPLGVRANCICPGLVDTPMLARLAPALEAVAGVPFADIVGQTQGRLITPRDIAEVAAFLASDGASFVTGAHYVLDNGLTGASR